MKTLNKIKSEIKTLIKDVEEISKSRLKYYSNKSEAWQEREAGFEYQNQTDDLDEVVDLLAECFDYLPVSIKAKS